MNPVWISISLNVLTIVFFGGFYFGRFKKLEKDFGVCFAKVIETGERVSRIEGRLNGKVIQ